MYEASVEDLKKLSDGELEAQLNAARLVQQELSREFQRRCELRAVAARAASAARTCNDKDLVYAAYQRCECGAGYAYHKDIGLWGEWDCSDVLTGRAAAGTKHSSRLPFSMYEVKSEGQPSAHGATTRPTPREIPHG